VIIYLNDKIAMDTNKCRFTSLYPAVALLLFAPFAGHTQTLNLYDAVTKGILNYPQLKERQAEVAAGRAHVNTVNGYRLPNLTLQDQIDVSTINKIPGAYLTYGMVPSVPGGNTSSITQSNTLDATNVALSFFQWNIFNFGYYNALTKEAKQQLAVNEANFGSDKYLLTQSIISLYIDWLKKFRLLQIQNENVQRAQVVLTAIRATVNSGLKPGVDSSTASATYSNARIAYLQALDDYNYDKITMSSYTGLNTDNAIPDSSLISGNRMQNLPAIQQENTVSADHPLLSVYEKQYEAQLADINAISRKYLPHIGVEGVGWVTNSGIPYSGVAPETPLEIPYSKYNYLLGATVTYDLFDLKHRQNELTEGKYLAEAKQNAVQNQQVSLNAMLQQANSTYAITQEKLKEAPVELFSARQAYNQQLALYRSGLNTLIDLTNAQYVLLQAETDYVNMQDQLLQILYVRAGLGGQLDNFLQNFKK
jgi:adhesin transport system outer membrane protein